MTERRRIGLNLNMPDLAHRESQDSMRGQREAPSDQAREQFKQALSKGDAAEQPARLPADSPFALLGRGAPSAKSRDEGEDAAHARQLARMSEVVERLMVGEGRSGQMVRVALAEEILPGVSINVSEAEGGWLVECECADEDSRELLCARAPDLVREMAERLARDTVWRITTDDPEDRRPFEARGQAEGGA